MTEQMHTPTDAQVEAAAQAICRASFQHWPDDTYNGRDQKRFYESQARAALLAALPLSPAVSSQERIAQLEAQVAEAVKVIEPFAQAADDLDDKHADRSEIWEAPAAMSITAGHLRAARAFLAGAQPLAPGPEGWQLVPKRATEAMIEAHFKAHAEATTVFAEVQSVWAHMLAAAPERIVGAAK